MEQQSTDDLLVDLSASRFSVAFSVMFFVFGTAAGFLLAFSGFGFLEDSAGVIAGVFLVALSVIALSGIALFLLRNRILTRLFGIAGAQIDVIAGPLADVAQGAARRDPEQAAQSARRLIQVALARYAWLATRRWIMTSLTALIAAMAALAGTALLFKQNALLAEQNTRISQQTTLLDAQTQLLTLDIQLSEAARNAALAVEVTSVAALLGEAIDRVAAAHADDPGIEAGVVPVLDPRTDLDRSVLFRIIAVSQALRPYRFLDPGFNEADDDDLMRHAMAARRDILPAAWARMAVQNGWSEPGAAAGLIDRPASPERGQLLRVMLGNGLRDLELPGFYGLDLSFAYARGLDVAGASMQNADLAYADLTDGHIVQTDLRGAVLANARFRRAQVLRARLDALPGTEARAPYATDQLSAYVTRLTGADFSGALIVDSNFSGADAVASLFDNALVVSADFSVTALGGASFRNAVLVAPVWDGAQLNSGDFDGAVLFGADPLADLEQRAAPGTFRPDRYRAAPVTLETALAGMRWASPDLATLQALVGDSPGWRLIRVADFE